MKKSLLTLALIAAALAGCTEKVSPDRLEEARQTAKENAEFNARIYKAANPRFTSDFTIISRSDTSQKNDCPQGDGWVDVSIMRVVDKTVEKVLLTCSSYSSSVGCYRTEDFEKDGNLASQNSKCRSEVPFPLPVLRK